VFYIESTILITFDGANNTYVNYHIRSCHQTKVWFFIKVAMNKITRDLQTSTNQNSIRSGFPKEIFSKMKMQTNKKTYV
jgi:hypothetical protein